MLEVAVCMQPSPMLKPIYSLQELLPSPKRPVVNPVTDRMVAWAASMGLTAVRETPVLPQRRRAPAKRAKSAKRAKAVSASR